jgi:hypothetical protein
VYGLTLEEDIDVLLGSSVLSEACVFGLRCGSEHSRLKLVHLSHLTLF